MHLTPTGNFLLRLGKFPAKKRLFVLILRRVNPPAKTDCMLNDAVAISKDLSVRVKEDDLKYETKGFKL